MRRFFSSGATPRRFGSRLRRHPPALARTPDTHRYRAPYRVIMSSKSIHAFERHRSQASTLPPPPADDPVALLEAEKRRQLMKASRAFAKAQDLDAQIALLKGLAS